MALSIPIDISPIQKAQSQPSKTFRIDWEKGRITGLIEGPDAMAQHAAVVMMTERYAYPFAFSSDFGMELVQFLRTDPPQSLLVEEIPRHIKDALLVDTRILGVADIKVTQAGDELSVEFTLSTIYGQIKTGGVFPNV